MDVKVQWPANVVSSAGDDLAAPIKDALGTLNLVELDSEDSTGWDTPFSRQAITAGALATTKWTGTAIASVGGIGALLAAIGTFWHATSVTERIAYGSLTVALIVGVAIALAVVVHADVAARGVATAAMYDARAQVARSFLATTERIVEHEPQYWAKSYIDHQWHPVTKFKKQDGRVVAEGPDGFTVTATDIEDLELGHIHSLR